MVSNANEDSPGPDKPVKTIRRSRGSSTSTFLRLCSRAPRIVIASATRSVYRDGCPSERMFGAPLLPAPELVPDLAEHLHLGGLLLSGEELIGRPNDDD